MVSFRLDFYADSSLAQVLKLLCAEYYDTGELSDEGTNLGYLNGK